MLAQQAAWRASLLHTKVAEFCIVESPLLNFSLQQLHVFQLGEGAAEGAWWQVLLGK
jgi:hypothetical protein